MKRLEKTVNSITLRAEDGSSLRVGYDNRGEPYRKGVSLYLEEPGYTRMCGVFIEDWEARELRDLLNMLYPALPQHQRGSENG